ncbi:ABC transporter permease [Paenibacillus sp. Aloe-11]|uniref:ABC transporter permease n=1 Tax=Paenibacillus sp. Aloe-11 TaxID=1050222 RepID=UPI00024EF678|nr:ABC transporter permease [Paenibacillus sp. Aloe-11]EHS55642.1 spermidine/putrescine ABC transporter permease II [Paenibacillus sp. Aloe-11]
MRLRGLSSWGYHLILFLIAMIVCLFLVLPLVIVVITSLNAAAYSVFPPTGLSLRWYENLLSQPQFLHAFGNSVFSSVCATLLALVAGTLAALAIQRFEFPGRSLLRAIFMSPMVVPKIALGIAYLILFSKLQIAGGLLALILGEAVTILPFVLSIIGSTLANVRREHEEAASDLGAGPLRVFFTVTLPQIRLGLLMSGAIAFIFTFDQVETALLILRPENNTLPIELFLYMEKWQDPTIAVVSTVMLLIALVLFFGLKLILRSVPEVQRVLGPKENE